MSDDGWMPIETAPKDGTVVDLWVVGTTSDVDFYSITAKKVKGKPFRHGRAENFVFAHKPPNSPNWYPVGGLLGYPLPYDVRPTHWRPLPAPPAEGE